MNRRHFLATSPLLLTASCKSQLTASDQITQRKDYTRLDAARDLPVLRKELFPEPVLLESVELLRHEDNFICRVRTKDGAEGISVSNNYQMVYLYPIATKRVAPYFVGMDARDLDDLIEGVYTHMSNYKLQSLALWVPVATVEFAILDLLGKIAKLPIHLLLAEEANLPRIPVYQANNNRGKSAEESLENIQKTVERTGAKAIKFKIAGRMNDEDLPRGRSEALIPAVRKAFGPDMTLYADANSGYGVADAIRVGKLLGDYDYSFFEEPIAFDRYPELKQVREAVKVPLAGGEQEGSMYNFRYLIGENALTYVQPDIFYFGGMIRSMRVARMAAEMGKPCVPHISGSGLGFLYMMHFVAALPNAGPYHEFKEKTKELPFDCPTASLRVEEGELAVPTGPGLGVVIEQAYLEKHRLVE